MENKASSDEKREFLARVKMAIKHKKAASPDITDDHIAAYLGVSRPTFTNYKNGKREFPSMHLSKFCEFLGVNERWLISNKGRIEADYVEKLELIRDEHLRYLQAHAGPPSAAKP